METRLAALGDVKQISAMFEHFYAYNAGQQPQYYRHAAVEGSSIRQVVESVQSDLFIVLDGNEIIGMLHAEEKSTPPSEACVPHKYADIMALFVDPTYRGQGIGESLIIAAKKWAEQRHLDYMEQFVLTENEGGMQFYGKMGFETVSTSMRLPL